MPVQNDPNMGLGYGFDEGESGWKPTMDANLKQLGALLHVSVIDRNLATPPAASDGDRYIVAAGGTGDWATHDDKIAVRVAGAWEFYTPATGWLAYIEDEQVLSVFRSGAWSAGTALT